MTRSLGLARVSVVAEGRDRASNDVRVRRQEATVEVRFGNLSAEAAGEMLESFPVQKVVVDVSRDTSGDPVAIEAAVGEAD
jgi:hypothetical protein